MSVDRERLLSAIDAGAENAYGGADDTELSERRAKSIDYYLGRNRNPAPEGRSQVVDRSVYETIQVMLPSLVRVFAGSSDEVCKCVAVGPDDEAAAEQTTAVLNHVVTAQNQWEQLCSDWIHDAMLLGNGYALAYWDESERLVRERYDGQSEDQLAALLSDDGVQIVEHAQEIDEEATQQAQQAYAQAVQQWQMAAGQAVQAGMPAPPQPQEPGPVMLHSVVIERRENEGKCCIRVIPPEHCRVSIATPDWTLSECPYFEFRERRTIADLRAMGLDVPEDISDDEDPRTEEDDARSRFGEDIDADDLHRGVMRSVWARMVWVRADAEDDGHARLYYALLVGRTVLYVEPCSRIPVASLTAQPMPHRHQGLSIAETVEDLQDVRTAVTRGALDNLYLANNGRHAVSSRVNLDDFLDARPGGVVRMLDDALPAEGHIMPLTHPFAFNEIVGSLEYFDQVRQNRTGASRYFSGTDAGAINKTASGTMALQNMASMRVEHIARMMAPGVEALFAAVQEIVAKHANKGFTIKLRGQWVTVDPQAWRTRRDVRISVGVGAGNRDSMMQHLGAMFGAQMQMLPLRLAGPQQIYATVLEMAKLAGFANPTKFWADPSQLPPAPPQPTPEQVTAQTQMQIKQMELSADAQKFQAQTAQRMQELQVQNEAKLAELRASLELQATNDMRDAERERAKAMIDAQIEAQKLEHERQIASLRAEVDKYKADLDAQVKLMIADKSAAPAVDMGPMQAAIERLAASMAAPAEIVRDPQSGRAVGVKRGEVVREIKRGPDGRVVGLQ